MRRKKTNKTYRTGMMVLIILCAMYMILYPTITKMMDKGDGGEETVVTEFSDDTGTEGDGEATGKTGEQNPAQDAAAQAIAAIEEKEKAAKESEDSGEEDAFEETWGDYAEDEEVTGDGPSEESVNSGDEEVTYADSSENGKIAETKASDTENSDTDTSTDLTTSSDDNNNDYQVYYQFRNKSKFESHFEKHGGEMGFSTAQEYLDAANALINNPDALHKYEKEDGDDIYFLESTNEIAFVSQDGYLRTYFICSGKNYYDRQ